MKSENVQVQILDWSARRQKRVVRSSFAAELNSAADALEHGKLISLALTEVAWPILGPTNLAASLEAGKLFLKISVLLAFRVQLLFTTIMSV